MFKIKTFKGLCLTDWIIMALALVGAATCGVFIGIEVVIFMT